MPGTVALGEDRQARSSLPRGVDRRLIRLQYLLRAHARVLTDEALALHAAAHRVANRAEEIVGGAERAQREPVRRRVRATALRLELATASTHGPDGVADSVGDGLPRGLDAGHRLIGVARRSSVERHAAKLDELAEDV